MLNIKVSIFLPLILWLWLCPLFHPENTPATDESSKNVAATGTDSTAENAPAAQPTPPTQTTPATGTKSLAKSVLAAVNAKFPPPVPSTTNGETTDEELEEGEIG